MFFVKKCNQSIRYRLMLWYSSLFGVILLFIMIFSYTFHVRGHYDDIDNALVSTAVNAMPHIANNSFGQDDAIGSGRFQVIIRFYQENGLLVPGTIDTPNSPKLNPLIALKNPMGPAYDFLAGISPPIEKPIHLSGGVFSTISYHGDRWRIYTVPFASNGRHFLIETMTPLTQVDNAIDIYRFALLAISLFGIITAAIGGCFIAGIALKPILTVIDTTDTIAHSHDLGQRLVLPPTSDEIGQLASTFNSMLDSLQKAEEVQKRFISDASHELRAPITVIKANLELIQRYQTIDLHEREEILATIGNETDRLSALVADLLLLARADSHTQLEFKSLQIDELILELMQTAHLMTHDHTLFLDQFEIAGIQGNLDKLRQLFLNIISNAIKYTPPGGEIHVSLHKNASDVTISIADTGVGIDPEDLPHIFDRFYRVDSARSRNVEGTGLGLSIVQWIVEQHHGEVVVESERQKGTTFTIILPITQFSYSSASPHAPLSLAI